MGFTRRFTTFPSQQVISQIEGVVIVDQAPPASIQGVATGVVGLVGEFADMRYAVNVDGSGNVTTRCRPVEVVTGQDMLNKVGGFDSTLGDFGGDDGNGFVAATNKIWSRLILAPVNLASSKGVRLWRDLPTNSLGTASPIKPMQAATVPAGFVFKDGNDRVKVGTAVTFTADGPLAYGTNGAITGTSTGAEQVFTATGATFTTSGVQVGDALVIGTLGTDDLAGTYRITEVTSATSLKFQKQDGAVFTPAAETGLSFRIHPSSTADTGAATVLADDGGFMIPARPLDAAIDDSTVLPPVVVAPTATAVRWDPLAGLAMATMFTAGNGLTFDADVQAPNPTQSSTMDALYDSALAAMLGDIEPMRSVSIIFAARTSEAISNALYTHVLTASASGVGRTAVLAPPVSTTSRDTVLGNDWPGVGANRAERVFYAWPGVQTRVQEANLIKIKCADGTYTTTGQLDVRADAYLASVLSNLAAERNPGQALDPIPLCLSTILDFQRGLTSDFTMNDYILFRDGGVVALRFDRITGKVFQSGITSSLIPGQKNINRRRFADEIQDSLAAAYAPLTKLPLTQQLKTTINSSTISYLEGLLSRGNPSAQRIEAYSVDSVSGNTPELTAQGIHVVIVRVRMLATSDDIVLQAEVGTTVNIATV